MDDGGRVAPGEVAAKRGAEDQAEFSALAARIAAAFDAIEAGSAEGAEHHPAQVEDRPSSHDRVVVLEDELEVERSANAQLSDRIERLKERHDATVARMEAETVEARAMLAEVESEMRQLRAVNDRLRATSRELRDACAGGLADTSGLNEAMRSELEAVNALRESERREMDTLIGELAPLVERESA